MRTPKIWKVCVIGDKGVGKTSLIRRFVFDTFEDDPEETLESKAFRKKCENSTLIIWDVSVYERNIRSILAGAKGIIVVGDITRRETYDTMGKIAEFLNGHKGKLIFVANKSDLKYQAQFWKDELNELSNFFDTPYFLTSAKTGENVNNAFKTFLEM